MDKDNWYTGAAGKNYLAQREGAQSAHNQGLRASLFADLGGAHATILDFGCGTGGVLSRVQAGKRIGVEIGIEAARMARESGLEIFSALAEVPTASIDVAISFHAIEHVDSPLAVLQELRRAVRPGGCVRLIVPCEMPTARLHRSWRQNNDRHLYTWTPLLFGNLAERAGFAEIACAIRPMPTGSRVVRAVRSVPPLAGAVRTLMSLRRNNFNVILNARVPA